MTLKILVLTGQLPSMFGGGVSRQFHLIKELSVRHEISLASYIYPVELPQVEALKPYLNKLELCEIPKSKPTSHSRLYWVFNAWWHTLFDTRPLRGRNFRNNLMRKRVLQLSREVKFDVIHVQQAYLAPIVPCSSSMVVLDMLDVLSEYERQFVQTQSKMTHRFQKWMEWKKMQVLERQAVRLSNASITMSEIDKARIARLYPDAQVWVIPNGVDLDYFRPLTLLNDNARRTSNQIVFIGSMNYLPNADAVRWFYHEIFKLIHQQIHRDNDSVGTSTNQDIHFTIVGLEPPNDIIEIGKDPYVTVTGWVEDVRPYIQNAAVIVVPLRYGSGTRLKILEAWAMGKAIVSTTLGAEGLPVKHGENILLADQPNDFAKAVSIILHDTPTKLKLGLSGRKLVENCFSWKSVADSMEQVYQCAF